MSQTTSTLRTSPAYSCLLIALVSLCLGAVCVSAVGVFLPMQAEKRFGPASVALNPVQHLYLSTLLLRQSGDLLRPPDLGPYKESLGVERDFSVVLGESTADIVARLENEGFIRSAEAMRNYLVYAGIDTTIQAGKHRLDPNLSALQIARQLQDATPTEVTFHVLPGWRLEEIADAIPTSGLEFSSQDFFTAASRPPDGYASLAGLPQFASLEGFLFPDTYTLARSTTVDEFIAILLANFEKHIDPQLVAGLESQGLNLFQAVSLASIVEREAVLDEEMPVIASVFLNRLEIGMSLESDPTVQYALGYNRSQGTWWTNPLSRQDLQVDSLYNTYRYPNLPPGPIASPGLAALKAVAFPAETPYYYFRAACDGSGKHRFAQTYEEHVNNACDP